MQARRYVEAPAAKPLPFGLLSAALVVPDADPHLGLGVQYETLACSLAHRTQDACVAEVTQPDPWLTSDEGQLLVVGDAFYVYALHTCRPVGGGAERIRANARARLDNGFGHGVEEGFEVSLADADDLTPTPGTAVHPMAGLAILEEYAASVYAGVPVLHIGRGIGTLLGQLGAVVRQGTQLQTVQGAAVASGGGYGAAVEVGGATTNDAASRWMRVTGAVVVRRGEPQDYMSALPARDVVAPGEYTNDLSSFAQQPVVVTAECINAAVLVTAPASYYSLDGGTP